MHVNVYKYIKALDLASDRVTDVQGDVTKLKNCTLSYVVLYTLSLRYCFLLHADNFQVASETVYIVIASFQHLFGPQLECLLLRNGIMIGFFSLHNAFTSEKNSKTYQTHNNTPAAAQFGIGDFRVWSLTINKFHENACSENHILLNSVHGFSTNNFHIF
jgi:hypothetical protein